MPRYGKQQTPAQKLQVDEMRRHGLALRSSRNANVIRPVDPRAASKRDKLSMKKDKAHQQSTRNGLKREERLREKAHSDQKVSTSLKEAGGNTD